MLYTDLNFLLDSRAFIGQILQLFPIDPHCLPFRHTRCANALALTNINDQLASSTCQDIRDLLEIDAWGIPLQHTPLQSSSIYPPDLSGKGSNQCRTIPSSTVLFSDKKIFKPYTRSSTPCGIIMEVESYTSRRG